MVSATYWQACPDVAVACHTLFFSQDHVDKLLSSKTKGTANIIKCNERFSINFIGGLGSICKSYFKAFIQSQEEFFKNNNGEEKAEADEPYLSFVHCANEHRFNYICMEFFVSHFAFGKQRGKHLAVGPKDEAYLDDDDRFVERYQTLAVKVHRNYNLIDIDSRKPRHVLIKETNEEDEKLLIQE